MRGNESLFIKEKKKRIGGNKMKIFGDASRTHSGLIAAESRGLWQRKEKKYIKRKRAGV
jgi:hypothetical protein